MLITVQITIVGGINILEPRVKVKALLEKNIMVKWHGDYSNSRVTMHGASFHMSSYELSLSSQNIQSSC